MPHTTVNVLVLGSRCNPEQRRWVMNEFDKHWNEWAIASNCTEDEVKSHFEAGQQSQKGEVDRLQTKIDYMQVRLDGANERALSILNHKNVMVDKMQAKIDELQTRIEKLLDYTGTSGHTPNWIIKEFLK